MSGRSDDLGVGNRWFPSFSPREGVGKLIAGDKPIAF